MVEGSARGLRQARAAAPASRARYLAIFAKTSGKIQAKIHGSRFSRRFFLRPHLSLRSDNCFRLHWPAGCDTSPTTDYSPIITMPVVTTRPKRKAAAASAPEEAPPSPAKALAAASRKKKEQKTKKAATETASAGEEPEKKKRGRPKKKAVSAAEEEGEGPTPPPEPKEVAVVEVGARFVDSEDEEEYEVTKMLKKSVLTKVVKTDKRHAIKDRNSWDMVYVQSKLTKTGVKY